SNQTRPSELAPVLEECDVNKVYITHLYPHTRDKEGEMLSTLRKAFEGKVWMAQDMKSINVEEGVEVDEE
ncbi:MAG: hypothetical protein SV760_10145, partial [Halobacteria archaeon]|nr:hypothetical protein [Halobacteria archaeon]